eukprot:2435125-Prymnesium_polylepis.1
MACEQWVCAIGRCALRTSVRAADSSVTLLASAVYAPVSTSGKSASTAFTIGTSFASTSPEAASSSVDARALSKSSCGQGVRRPKSTRSSDSRGAIAHGPGGGVHRGVLSSGAPCRMRSSAASARGTRRPAQGPRRCTSWPSRPSAQKATG